MRQTSFNIEKRILYSAPSSGSQLTRYFSPRRFAAAFLIILWQPGTERSSLSRLQPSTGKAAERGSQASKGSALTPSKSSSKLLAGNSPSTSSMRSAKRERMFARASPAISVVNKTRPFSGATDSMPMCLSSLPSGPSRPKRQLAARRRPPFGSFFAIVIPPGAKFNTLTFI